MFDLNRTNCKKNISRMRKAVLLVPGYSLFVWVTLHIFTISITSLFCDPPSLFTVDLWVSECLTQ